MLTTRTYAAACPRRCRAFIVALLFTAAAGGLLTGPARADEVTNVLSIYPMVVDGAFSDGVPASFGQSAGEWGDIIPLAFVTQGEDLFRTYLGDPNTTSLLYAGLQDSGAGGTLTGEPDGYLYTLFDLPARTLPVKELEVVVSIGFDIVYEGVRRPAEVYGIGDTVGGAVFSAELPAVQINGVLFPSVSFPEAASLGIAAALGFSPSPLSATGHMVAELAVPLLIDGFFPDGIYPPEENWWETSFIDDAGDPPGSSALFTVNPPLLEPTGLGASNTRPWSVTINSNALPSATSIPEPSSLALVGLGALALLAWRRRARTP